MNRIIFNSDFDSKKNILYKEIKVEAYYKLFYNFLKARRKLVKVYVMKRASSYMNLLNIKLN